MIKLNAYRFSAKELVKMGWLKDIFQDNGFVIDRFPEVYYDTFKNASKVYPNLEQHINEDTPDYLGVYIFEYGDEKCEEQCRSTKEGVIVLFSDRIQDFCLRKQSEFSESLIDIENALREVVLYHELGHWLSHWPYYSGSNWKCGYSAKDRITHEVYAQLVAYWCVEGHRLNELLLREHLTPKIPSSPYNKYELLVGKSKVDMLSKLVLLRKYWCSFQLTDELAYELLKMDLIEKCVAYAFENSVRKIQLNVQALKSLGNEIAFQVLAMGWSCENGELTCIEYDFALCKLLALRLLDETELREVLNFEKKYCDENSRKGIRLIHRFGL
jgi:hypothetical protein